MAPWTAVPALVALTSDPARDVGALALQLLKRQAERQADFVSNYLGAGLLAMHDFQQRLWQAGHPDTSTPLGLPCLLAWQKLCPFFVPGSHASSAGSH